MPPTLAELAWKSYIPLFRAIHAGSATAATYAQLDKLMLEDYADLSEHAGKDKFLLFWILDQLWKLSRGVQAQDQLYDALEYHNIMAPLLSMKVMERDNPALVDVGNREAALAAAQAECKAFKGYLTRMHDYELYPAVYEDLANSVVKATRQRHEALMKRVRVRCATYKEDLMAAAWHPRRVERWLNAGIEVDDM